MTGKTIAFAADHAGYALKSALIDDAKSKGYPIIDCGTDSDTSVDYPDFAYLLATAIKEGKADMGVAICGSGIGISIAVNREPTVRAALCLNEDMAILARQHNDANVLVIGSRFTDLDTSLICFEAFLNTPFSEGRHRRRVNKLYIEKE